MGGARRRRKEKADKFLEQSIAHIMGGVPASQPFQKKSSLDEVRAEFGEVTDRLSSQSNLATQG